LIFNALRDSRLEKRSGDMSDLYWLTDEQMAKLAPFFPKSHGKPRVHCPAGHCAAMSREG
jgi:hypothetical protein